MDQRSTEVEARSRETASAVEFLLRDLVAFDTTSSGPDHLRCVEWISSHLQSFGFDVVTTEASLGPPCIKASRAGTPGAGTLVMYGHYDVDRVSNAADWSTDPFDLRERSERWTGLGVGDNKGPLACRLAAIERLGRDPSVVWLIQGEEETGSRVAREVFPRWLAGVEATAWLDETGYHAQATRSLRLIACGTDSAGAPADPDASLRSLLDVLETSSTDAGRSVERAVRRLNKSLVPGGCPFQANLPPGARYLALGVNDSASSIHQAGESVPIWAFDAHLRQLELLWQWLSTGEPAT